MKSRSILPLVPWTRSDPCSDNRYTGAPLRRSVHVDVFFLEDRVPLPFHVIGVVEGRADSMATIEGDFARAGLSYGADAVLVDGLSTQEARSVSPVGAQSNGRPRYVVDASGALCNVGGAEHHARLVCPSAPSVLTARLLRYDR